MSATPAGWYDDGSGTGRLRYWDGAAWTQHFHDPQQAAAQQATADHATTQQATAEQATTEQAATQQPTTQYGEQVATDPYAQAGADQQAAGSYADPFARPEATDPYTQQAAAGAYGHTDPHGHQQTQWAGNGSTIDPSGQAPKKSGVAPWVWGVIAAGVVVVLGAIAVIVVLLTSGGGSADEAAVEATVEEFYEAAVTWDCDGMESNLTQAAKDDWFGGMSCQELSDLAGDLLSQEDLASQAEAMDLTYTAVTVEETTATVRISGELDGVADEVEVDLVKEGDTWLVDTGASELL